MRENKQERELEEHYESAIEVEEESAEQFLPEELIYQKRCSILTENANRTTGLGGFEYVNAAFEKRAGYKEECSNNNNFFGLIRLEDRKLKEREKIQKEGKGLPLKIELVKNAGVPVHVDSHTAMGLPKTVSAELHSMNLDRSGRTVIRMAFRRLTT